MLLIVRAVKADTQNYVVVFFVFFMGGGVFFWIGGRILARTRRLELLGIVGYNTKS